MNPISYPFHYECVIATRLLNLFLNVSTPQSTNLLTSSMCINCFIIPLHEMPLQSECTSGDFPGGAVDRICLPMQVVRFLPLVREPRSHMHQGQNPRT